MSNKSIVKYVYEYYGPPQQNDAQFIVNAIALGGGIIAGQLVGNMISKKILKKKKMETLNKELKEKENVK